MINLEHPIVKAIEDRLLNPQVPREPRRGRKKTCATLWRSAEPALARLWQHIRRRGQGGGR